jgi:hypothetical protein
MKMHTRLVTAAAGLLALLGAAAAHAQSFEVTAKVPFEFTAGPTTLAAGAYRLEARQGVLLVRNDKKGVFVLAQSTEPGTRDRKPTRLVFHRYGDRYYLRQVWYPGTRGYVLPETPGERESAATKGRMASHRVVVTLVAAVS